MFESTHQYLLGHITCTACKHLSERDQIFIFFTIYIYIYKYIYIILQCIYSIHMALSKYGADAIDESLLYKVENICVYYNIYIYIYIYIYKWWQIKWYISGLYCNIPQNCHVDRIYAL